MSIHAFICALFLLSTFGSAGQSNPRYPSLLWEITSNETSSPSYLYGTMHVSNKVAFHLGDSFFLALRSVDHVALESDPSRWLNYMLDSAYLEENGLLYRTGSYYRDFYRQAFAVHAPERKQLAAALNFNSGMVNGMLYRNSRSNADYEEDTYLDMYIYQAGKKWGKKILGLEDFMESNQLVRRSMEPNPDEKEEDLLKPYQKLVRQGKKPQEMMEDAYRNGDLDMVDSLQKILNPGINHQKYMLWVRNRNMVSELDSLLKNGLSVFAGVGAAHLAGDSGMIEMLRHLGYKLRPVQRLINDQSREKRNLLERTYVDQQFKTYFSSDSLFEVALPGPFFEIPENKQIKMYFFPEMDNGTTYSLTRFRTYGALRGESPEYALSRIDSILYESIPGKILKQERIERNGYPGFDILNRTRKGNHERYLILATELEYFIFKVSGTLDYLPDNGQLEEVFRTFQIHRGDDHVRTWHDSLAGLSIRMPGLPIRESGRTSVLMGNSDIEYQSLDASGNFYRLRRAGLHDFRYIEEDTFELNYMMDKFLESVELEAEYAQHNDRGAYPARYVRCRDSGDWIHLYHLIKGPHYYQLLLRNTDSSFPSDFFGSLNFFEPTYIFPFVEFVDTNLHYCVRSPVKYAGWNARTFRREKEPDAKDRFGEENRFRNFSILPSDERIFLGYQKLDVYFHAPTRDSMYRRELRSFLHQQSLFLKESHFAADSSFADFIFSDTNSSRCIHARCVLAGDRVYMFGVTTDTASGLSPFARTFFDSFRVKDSTVGLPYYRSKSDVLLQNLRGSDSLAVIYAIQSLDEVEFSSEQAPELIRLIESYKHPEFKIQHRAELIEQLGKLRHPQVMPYLESVYIRSADTAQLQIAVLKGLAKRKTRRSTEQIGKLLDLETPLSSPSEIEWMFWDWYDSLKLFRLLYPDLLQYAHYSEYKYPVLEMLADLLDSNWVKPRTYKRYKKDLVREAKDNLKRKMAIAPIEDENYFDEEDRSYNYDAIVRAFVPILLPYVRDKTVADYFMRSLRVRDDDLKISILCSVLLHGCSVNDSFWNHFAERDETRLTLFRELDQIGRTDLFPSKFLEPEFIARALLYEGVKPEHTDSVELYQRIQAIGKNGAGYIYIFKHPEEDNDDEWQIDYVGLIPENPTRIPLTTDVMRRNLSYYDDEEMQELFDEVRESLRFEKRKRVVHETKYQRYR
ncbi:MAG: TraB/GumN family protein [Flavobacteriales bacterium]|nr:TraB/GumN family protein [Flavobacteriales bacterium]